MIGLNHEEISRVEIVEQALKSIIPPPPPPPLSERAHRPSEVSMARTAIERSQGDGRQTRWQAWDDALPGLLDNLHSGDSS